MIQLTYRRLSGRIQRFEQPLLHETGDCFVTFLPSAELSKPLRVGGEVVLPARYESTTNSCRGP